MFEILSFLLTRLNLAFFCKPQAGLKVVSCFKYVYKITSFVYVNLDSLIQAGLNKKKYFMLVVSITKKADKVA